MREVRRPPNLLDNRASEKDLEHVRDVAVQRAMLTRREP